MSTNWALASNGCTATASVAPVAGSIGATQDGSRHTGGWPASGFDSGIVPVTFTYDFGAPRQVVEVDVFTVADAVNYTEDPEISDVFTLYGITAYRVEYWDGAAWANLVTVAGNNKVWRRHKFSEIVTSKVRLVVTGGLANSARLVEFEAWAPYWDPQINVFDETSVKDNLIEFIQNNQALALTWANEGVELPSIAVFNRSNRPTTRFPALTFLQTSHESNYEDGGILTVDFEALLELALIHGDMDTAADRSTRYAMALESMIVNVPETTFREGSILTIESTSGRFRITHAEQGKYKNSYIQVFQARAAWHIEAAAYSN